MLIKNWVKPQLQIIIRSNPEEMILTACKGTRRSGRTGGGTNSNNAEKSGCVYSTAGNNCQGQCTDLHIS